MPAAARPSKQRPSEVAAETKRHYFPIIRNNVEWSTFSFLYPDPLAQMSFPDPPPSLGPPEFYVQHGDPVDFALEWTAQYGASVPVVCAANDKRPGGDWETGVNGYEERLCRRSSLAAALAVPGPGSYMEQNYPMPVFGAIWSPDVVVFRGPHDTYEKWPPEAWRSLPMCSVAPMRWPKLTPGGAKYSFAKEREMVKAKLCGALRTCAFNNCTAVTIGDFGLGNAYRNPPQELAELWREIFLYDPDLRGRIRYVAFVFEDPAQSTAQLILDDMEKKSKGRGSGSRSTGKSSSSKGSNSSSSSGHGGTSGSNRAVRNPGIPTDYEIFQRVFDNDEVRRVMGQRDSRCGLANLLA